MEKGQMFAVLAVVIIAAAGIGGGIYYFTKDKGNDGPTETTVTDSVGNVIDITKEYNKIASTTAVGTEVVCDLGLRSSLVGVTNSAHIYDMTTHVNGINLEFDYPATIAADIAGGKLVAYGWSWSTEQVASSNPDLVILDPSSVAASDEKMKQLQALGITCVVIYDGDEWEAIKNNYTILGKILHKQSRATEIYNAAVAADQKIMDKFNGQTSKKIGYVCYCWGSYYIYNTSGFMDAALRLGCTNALPSATTTTITAEQLAAADIDYLFFDDMGTSLNWSEVITGWKADPVMSTVSAIANDNFYCMEATPFQATSYPTIHYVMGEGLVATMIYPTVVGVSIPNVITDANYVGYLSWMDA